jgi:modification target Cys-rich repeat protein
MSPLLGTLAGATAKAFGMMAAALKPILDTFTRTTSGYLGTATSGENWVATRGTWFANGTKAQSNDGASNNSIASIPFKSDAIVTGEVTGGTGLVFWLTDADSWWAATSYNTSTTSSYSCNPYSCNPYSCNPYSCSYSCNPYSCNCSTSYSCAAYGSGCFGQGVFLGFGSTYDNTSCYCESNGSYLGPASATTTCQTCYQTCYTTCYNTCYDTCYQTCTGTTYSFYLRLLSSIGGTVSTATGDISLASQAGAIWLETIGNSITVKAYTDAGLVTQLGSTMTANPVSPVKGSSVGIIKTLSPHVQGTTIDAFQAN